MKELWLPFYTTPLGAAYLGDSLDLLDNLDDGSVNLVLTSPPFALTRKKEYGNEQEEAYIEWFLPFAKKVFNVLKDDGSFVIDLGGAYIPGSPVKSLYQYELLLRLCKELGFFLAQDFFHYNPSRLPAPAEWVNVRRCRVKDSVNTVWWLSKTPWPKSDNRNVLNEYSNSMKSLLKNGYKAKMRPSGHDISTKFSKDNGGSVPSNVLGLASLDPSNLLVAANTESNSSYLRMCKEHGYKPHPARFPSYFAEFFIKFLTEPGDMVVDIFAGSNTTGYVSEVLERKWQAFELSRDYLEASALRFELADKELMPEPVKLGGLFALERVKKYAAGEN